MTIKDIQTFLSNRPAISVTKMCEEAGITKRYLDYILNGEMRLTENVVRKLTPIMEKYGYG